MRVLLGALLAIIGGQAVMAQTMPPVPKITDIPHPKPFWHYKYSAVWNESLPYYKDPVQAKKYDCWLPAASISVTWVNPDWIPRLFYYTDGSPMRGAWFPSDEWAMVRLWNPADGSRVNFTVNLYNKSLTEDNAGGNWWHSALTQGFQQMAGLTNVYGIYPNGSIWWNQGIPLVAMYMLTGYPLEVKEIYRYASIDDWWGTLIHAQESPVVVTTIGKPADSTPQIYGNHAYAVLMTRETDPSMGGGRTVLMRNPWGTQDWYKAEDVFKACYYTNYVVGSKKLEWTDDLG